MRPVVLKVGPLATASGTAVAASQGLAVAGPLVLNGSTVANGVAVLDTARRVAITSAGNDSGLTFTIFGTNWTGAPISEALAGANAGSVVSALDYATVTKITASGAVASTVTVGTNNTASSPWFRMDDYGTSSVSIGFAVYGTATTTLQYSFDDPNSLSNPVAPSAMTWLNSPDPSLQAFTSSVFTSLSQNVAYIRMVLTAGTGSVTATLVQGGSPPA